MTRVGRRLNRGSIRPCLRPEEPIISMAGSNGTSMLKLILPLALGLALSTTAKAEDVGACAWAKFPAADRQAFLDAYKTGVKDGMASLDLSDEKLRSLVNECAHRDDTPRAWAQALIIFNAFQEGAAYDLATDGGITREKLDKAWRETPKNVVDCTRAEAAKAYGVKAQPCADPKSTLWFLDHFSFKDAKSPSLPTQLILYFNAKAEAELTETLFAKFAVQGAGSYKGPQPPGATSPTP